MQIHPKREQCVNSSPQASASPSAHVSCSAFLPLLPCTSLPLSVRVFRRPSFSVTGKVWEEINQQSIGRIQLDSKVVNPPYLHHPATIMLLTCRGFVTSRSTVQFFPEERPMPPIFPFLGAARSGRVPTSTVDSLTCLLMLSWR